MQYYNTFFDKLKLKERVKKLLVLQGFGDADTPERYDEARLALHDLKIDKIIMLTKATPIDKQATLIFSNRPSYSVANEVDTLLKMYGV